MNQRNQDDFEPLAPLTTDDHEEVLPRRGDTAVPPRAKVGGWQGKSLVVIGLVAIAGLAFWSVRLNSQLQQAYVTLGEYQQSLAQLEQRLQVTDESLDQSSIQTEDKLSNLDTEIRKLWDNVWKRSKQQLEAHEARLETLEKTAAVLQQDLKKQAVAISAVDKKIGGVQVTVARLAEQLDTVNGNYETVSASVVAVNRKLGELGAGISGASSDKELMSKRIQELEGWVKSINEYRRQVNERLLQLEGSSQGGP